MNRTAGTCRGSRGFTLVALCAGIDIGICDALMGQVVPAMSQLYRRQALKVTSDTLAPPALCAQGGAVIQAEMDAARLGHQALAMLDLQCLGVAADAHSLTNGQPFPLDGAAAGRPADRLDTGAFATVLGASVQHAAGLRAFAADAKEHRIAEAGGHHLPVRSHQRPHTQPPGRYQDRRLEQVQLSPSFVVSADQR